MGGAPRKAMQKSVWKGKKGAGKGQEQVRDDYKNRRNANVVAKFDEDARKEFLTGFHKRKEKRRAIAQAEIVKKRKKEQADKRKEKRKVLLEHVANLQRAIDATRDDHSGDEQMDTMVFDGDQTVTTVTVSTMEAPSDQAFQMRASLEPGSEEVLTSMAEKKKPKKFVIAKRKPGKFKGKSMSKKKRHR